MTAATAKILRKEAGLEQYVDSYLADAKKSRAAELGLLGESEVDARGFVTKQEVGVERRTC